MRVELLFDRDCPNVSATRANLSYALRSAKLPETWTEWDQSAADIPAYALSFGSPTVLVDGSDVGGVSASAAASCCRLYDPGENGARGVPSIALIEAALLRERSPGKICGSKQNLLTVPGILVSILPFGGCPACWPIYGGVLSSLGMGFMLSSRYLFPLTAIFLFLTLFLLGNRAMTRHGYGPLLLGIAGSALVLSGRFLFEFNMLAYFGVAVVAASSLWNSWPRRSAAGQCPKCTPSETDFVQVSTQERSL
jgi:mercuric ion transport protein